MAYSMNRSLKDTRHKLELYITKLRVISLTKLKKGYALVRGEDGMPVQSIKMVAKNDLLRISLLDGDIVSRVDDIEEHNYL